MNNYELKKNQAFERKKPFLFLKRLEQEGYAVMIHDQETQLLKLYGNRDEEEAALDLETAIVDDLQAADSQLNTSCYEDAQFQKAMRTLYSTSNNKPIKGEAASV